MITTPRPRFGIAILLLAASAVVDLAFVAGHRAYAAPDLLGGSQVISEAFGETKEGQPITLFTCVNAHGRVLKLIDYGAIVVSMEVPDRAGIMQNINLGFPTLAGYLQRHPYFGATVGRYCNRIAAGKFALDGKTYRLATNNGPNHLHGGIRGFDAQVWQAEPIQADHAVGVRFTLQSPDGEEGYPGNVTVIATYLLTDNNELRVDLEATTDQTTVINLTNHSYWNLAGAGMGKILDHVLTLAADHYLPVDETLIPTGEVAPVDGTPLDFTQPTAIGERLQQVGDSPKGYDHCYVVNGDAGELRFAARVKHPGTGRVMEIRTTQPGIQFYTGNFLDGQPASGGFEQHSAFCLETQHYPDSPNHPEFPSTLLKPGERFHQTTVHTFLVE